MLQLNHVQLKEEGDVEECNVLGRFGGWLWGVILGAGGGRGGRFWGVVVALGAFRAPCRRVAGLRWLRRG